MSCPTALELYEAARAAILSLLSNPVKSASFQGREYTNADLPVLQNLETHYKREAMRNGELLSRDGPVNVSTAWISDPWIYN